MAELEDYATAQFPDLTPAEKILLRAAARGLVADCAAVDRDAGIMRNRSNGSESRTVRSEVLRWLCVEPQAAQCVDLRGITIASARIAGKLDLAYASLRFPLTIANSVISDGIDLTHAETRLIALDGSTCGPVTAHAIAVRGAMSLRSLRALGVVDISGAIISDDVHCTEAHLLHRGAVALDAEHSNIGGSLRMDKGFRAFGLVNLRGAAIGDNLDCSAGVLLNRNRIALMANGIKVGGSVILDDRFRTNGMVALQRATIGNDVTFRRALFTGNELGGADLSRASVEGRLVWMKIEKTPRTTLDLSYAQFEQLADEAASWPAAENFAIDGCRYNSIASGLTQLEDRLRMLRSVRPFSPQAYTELAGALRRQGREREAMQVAIEREELRRDHEKMSFLARLSHRLFGIATGHGYKAYRVMFVPAFFVLAGWLLFSVGYREGVVMPASDQVYEQFLHTRTLPPSYPSFNPLIYSLDTFLPLTDFHQEDYWYPNPNRNCRSFSHAEPCGTVLHWYLGVHILAGWVFAILGLAGLLAKPPT
ncbi:MAG TPA: hypothetical protein VKB84_16135 [Candidatus Binataceae bacterium]|nr:hypothetical protein [Candidatus Binataceae bacterium]